MTVSSALFGSTALPVPSPFEPFVALGIPLGAVPIGLALGYFLYRAIRFLRDRGRVAPARPETPAGPAEEEVTATVTTATSTESVRFARPSHPPSQDPPKNNRFTLALLVVFASVASVVLVFYRMLVPHYNVLVAWVGKAIFWPTPWVASHTASEVSGSTTTSSRCISR